MAKDLEKLLGGYATGTLTEAERAALFEAALDDQQLFDALADEEALRELLDDPQSRSRLLGMLEQTSPRQRKGWLATVVEPFRRPVNLALAGSVVVAAAAVFVFANLMREAPVETPGGAQADRADDPVRPREQRAQRPEDRKSTALPSASPAPRADRAAGPHRPARPPSAAAGRTTAPRGRMRDTGESKPALRLSLTPSFPKGPARELFYSSELQRRPAWDARPAPLRGQETTAGAQQGTETTVPAPSELAEFKTPQDHPLIGLRLGLESRGATGVYVATDLDSPFETHDDARLTAETNAEAYLYAGKVEAGTWHWLFPPPGGPGAGPSAARIPPGQRLTLPLRIDARAGQAPGRNRLLIILSHRALPELEKTLSLASERAVPAKNIQDLLKRHSAPNAKEAPIVQQQSEKKIYFVSRSAAPVVPLVIAFDVLPR